MSETNIIPVEMRALVTSRLFTSAARKPPRHVTSVSDTVVPLELGEIRKTQRRVAALLNRPEVSSKDKELRRPVAPKLSYAYNNPNRPLVASSAYVDHVPDPSRVSDLDPVTHTKVAWMDKATCISPPRDDTDTKVVEADSLQRQPLTRDPARFSLPPVFSSHRFPTSGGLVHAVNENTLTSSNYKDTDVDCPSTDDRVSRQNVDVHDQAAKDRKIFSSATNLPKIDKDQNLVSKTGGHETTLRDGGRRVKSKEYRVKIVPGQKSLTPAERGQCLADDPGDAFRHSLDLHRTMTLESEHTSGSLRIDEDYVPMSVTIRKLTETDMTTSGHSPYQEFSDIFSSNSGSTRQSSPADNKNNDDDNNISVPQTMTKKKKRCQCPSSAALQADQCPECRLQDSHEDWCTSAGRPYLCPTCGRPVKVKDVGLHRRKSLGSAHVTDILITSELPASRETSKHGGRERRQPRPQKSKNGNSSRTIRHQHRVTFNKDVQRISPRTALEHFSDQNTNNSFAKNVFDDKDMNDSFENSQQSNRDDGGPYFQKSQVGKFSDTVVKVPTLGVNIHRTAYILALQDSKSRGKARTKRKGNKGREEKPEVKQGTVFSYFPLLRRPFSEPEREVLDLGLKADLGSNVKVKHTMKHIFGNINMRDYYPGGRKWRPLRE